MTTPTTQGAKPERGNALAEQLLGQRYLRRDADGHVTETVEEMYRRVARCVAGVEEGYGKQTAEVDALAEQFFHIMTQGTFLPNSPTMMNAGRDNGMLSACFVLPVQDSIEGIFDAVKQTALIQKAGGGTGFAFDALRPTGDRVASSGGTTSGPISFLRVFSEATQAIQQGAFRRGASMAMMAVDHPDILNFIAAKGKPGELENFNLSVKLTDAFMEQLRDRPDSPHAVRNPRTNRQYVLPKALSTPGYGIGDLLPVSQAGKTPCHTVSDIWDMIVSSAHATGEPGICFIDRVNQTNPTPSLGRIEATNPCGEQPLLPYESCTLGSINLAGLVTDNGDDLDWPAFERLVGLSVRFLDDVLDLNRYPSEKIKARTLGNRKIGLGIMGFADALVLLGVRYDSVEAERLAGRIASSLTQTAHKASRALSDERSSFPNWVASTWYTQHKQSMRNAACTTIAPTGSISILAGSSSGIEPIYSLAMRRRALDGKEFIQVHPLLEHIGRQEGWMSDATRRALVEGTPPGQIHGFPGRLADVLVTAHQVPPEWHVRIQAAFQQHIDNAVSKTVNLSACAEIAEVDKVFRLAHKLGCKGITVYRDGSRSGQTLSTGAHRASSEKTAGLAPRPRPHTTEGQTLKFRMGCGTLFVTVNRDDQGVCEVFANLGKAGGCPSQSEATCRVVSAALRSGVAPEALAEQLKGIRCLSTSVARRDNGEIAVLSCPDAIARAIEEAMGGDPEDATIAEAATLGRPCPHCGQAMRRESGCFLCDQCQYSSCG